MIVVRLFFRLDSHFFRFETVGRISFDETQELGVFACAGWAVEDEIPELGYACGHRIALFGQFGMEIELFCGLYIFIAR